MPRPVIPPSCVSCFPWWTAESFGLISFLDHYSCQLISCFSNDHFDSLTFVVVIENKCKCWFPAFWRLTNLEPEDFSTWTTIKRNRYVWCSHEPTSELYFSEHVELCRASVPRKFSSKTDWISSLRCDRINHGGRTGKLIRHRTPDEGRVQAAIRENLPKLSFHLRFPLTLKCTELGFAVCYDFFFLFFM